MQNEETVHPFPTDLPDYTEFEDEKKLNRAQLKSRKKIKPSNPRPPFINNCGYDIAGEFLNHLYPGLNDRVLPETREKLLNDYGKIIEFNQTEFNPDPSYPNGGLAPTGYMFIPKEC